MRNSRRLLVLLGLCWLAGLAWIWGSPALPFQDLVAHAGFLATRLRFSGSPVEQAVLRYAPHLGPYSLFHTLGALASLVMAPLAAMRTLASLVWLAYPLALGHARRRLTGERWVGAAFVGMLLALGLMTMLGLASYQLAAAWLLVVNAEWLLLLRGPAPSMRRLVGFAPLPVVLFFAHGFAFTLFVLLAAVSLGHEARRGWKRLVASLAPALSVAAVSSVSLVERSFAASHDLRFQGLGDKLALLVTPTLLTRFGVDAAITLGLWALALHAAVRAWRRRDPSRVLAVQAAALLLAFAFLPHAVGPFGFVDGRVLPTVLALALLCTPHAFGTSLDWALGGATSLLLACALLASTRFQHEAAGSERIAAHVPAGARLLHLPLDPDSRVFAAHPFLHYDKLALIERPLIVSDIWFHEATALYARPGHPALRLPKRRYSVLGEPRWSDYRLDDWDYVLCRTQVDGAEPPDVPQRLRRVEHVGGFWLYRVEPEAGASSAMIPAGDPRSVASGLYRAEKPE